MKVNELRINNLLKIGEEPLRVISLGVNPISTGYILCAAKGGQVYHDGFSPIPLTPEILEKAGFEFYDSEVYDYEDDENDFIFQSWRKWKNKIVYYRVDLVPEEYCYMFGISRFNDDHTFTLSGCKYVHQLQNIFFALTGEELNIEM
jgi:hypothetical protein